MVDIAPELCTETFDGVTAGLKYGQTLKSGNSWNARLEFYQQAGKDDGSGETQIFIPASTGINPFKIPFIEVGARITAVGLSGQFLTQNEVLPRHRGDLKPAVP